LDGPPCVLTDNVDGARTPPFAAPSKDAPSPRAIGAPPTGRVCVESRLGRGSLRATNICVVLSTELGRAVSNRSRAGATLLAINVDADRSFPSRRVSVGLRFRKQADHDANKQADHDVNLYTSIGCGDGVASLHPGRQKGETTLTVPAADLGRGERGSENGGCPTPDLVGPHQRAATNLARILIAIQGSLNSHLALPEVTADEGRPDSRIDRRNRAYSMMSGCWS
jgi:hypothetical protein